MRVDNYAARLKKLIMRSWVVDTAELTVFHARNNESTDTFSHFLVSAIARVCTNAET